MSAPFQILGPDGTPARQSMSTPLHAADRFSQELASWQPNVESGDSEWLADRDTVVGRAQDLARNDGWAAGAQRTRLVNVLGANLKLQAKPDYKALGLDFDWSVEWGRNAEAIFRSYAEDPRYLCDVRRRQNLAGLAGSAFMDYFRAGEGIAVVYWMRNATGYKTRFKIVDPDRLSNPHGKQDTDRLKGGIELDAYGAPVAYHFRNSHPSERGSSRDRYSWVRIPARTRHGRLRVIHYFNPDRSEQNRGKSVLTPILKDLKVHSKLSSASLQSALIQSLIAAVLESPVDTGIMGQLFDEGSGEVGNYQEARSEFHKMRGLNLQGNQIPQLFPGEKLNYLQSTQPGPAFSEFERSVLRHVAAGIGTSYEQLSQDWSSVNYSSARAALLEAWKIIMFERDTFREGFIRQIYTLILEEAISRGDLEMPVGAPSFYEGLAAYTRCRVLGPPRGWIDPLKEAQAAVLRRESGLSTFEQECAEQGLDWEEVFEQRAREEAAMERLGISPPQSISNYQANTDKEDTSEEGGDTLEGDEDDE